ncbi:MAG: hypothetical protein GVY02_09535 [Bacteroidetes bacterium]|nr:hypothetical protein [Bacteroidota bacterium]
MRFTQLNRGSHAVPYGTGDVWRLILCYREVVPTGRGALAATIDFELIPRMDGSA